MNNTNNTTLARLAELHRLAVLAWNSGDLDAAAEYAEQISQTA